jgi:MoxR-like ATPase
MMKIKMGYPEKDEELTLLKRKEIGNFNDVGKVIEVDEVMSLIKAVKKVKASDAILLYIHEIGKRIRNDERVSFGASPRALEHLLLASKASAFLEGRNYVIPDDVKKLAVRVLAHRIKLKPEYEVNEINTEDLVEEILEEVEIPK